ncbi:MAG: 2-amino-4-hydroxy-6-hydroxymethyldihydropteridine diphosphokinase [bacterium]|nr:2-amino-4-hydroxy-6-hydroxymethyldihydropteridine diphosphokinase [bacterium]
MEIYLGLGSNLGDRREKLSSAIRLLEGKGLRVNRVSPVVESPALLPESAPSDWNLPYLNLAVACETESSPEQVRAWTVKIESSLGRRGRTERRGGLGRDERERWSPRPIDIDILLWGREVISTPELAIPHRDLHKRAFVLTPLTALQPRLTIPGRGPKTVLEWSAELQHHIPLWMGIVNVTPDSFSDGGLFTTWERVEPHVEAVAAAGGHIVDVGAQSTRPNAKPVGPEKEWSRLAPILEPLTAKYSRSPLRPLLSVDTYHPAVAEKALDLGVDIVNDVGGLTSPEMIDIARSSDADWIAMHQLTLPVDPRVTLPPDCDPVAEVEAWLHARLRAWEAAGWISSGSFSIPASGSARTRCSRSSCSVGPVGFASTV